MPLFTYQVIEKTGKKRSGIIEASSLGIAKKELKSQGVMITYLDLQKRQSKKQIMNSSHLLAFTIQLSQLIDAKVPLYESLVAIEEQSRLENYHPVLLSISEQIKNGNSLSKSLKQFPESFSSLYCSLIQAGEATGDLALSLESIKELLTKQIRLRKQIFSALTYPILLTFFAMIVVFVLLGFVIPSIEGIFEEGSVNQFTQMVFQVSKGFRRYGFAFFMITSVIGFFTYQKLRKKKNFFQALFLKIPLIKTLIIQASVIRFCRTLSILQKGGLAMIESLQIARSTMNNRKMEEEMEIAEQKIIEGEKLSAGLFRSKYFPSLVARMVAVGEESGSTTSILQKIADLYEEEWQKTVDQLMVLFQPLLLIFLGGIIVLVLLAILLPLSDISSFSLG